MRPHAVTDQTSPRLRDQLRTLLTEDHAELERRLEAIATSASKGDAFALCESWRSFEDAVVRHLDAEEREIIPAFAQEHADAAAALLAEHARIRAQATELGVGVDLHCTRSEQVAAFVRLLRAHVRNEEDVLYPWAALLLGHGARRRVRRALLSRRTHPLANPRERWTVDPARSTLEFSLRHIVVQQIRGHFNRWGGGIDLDPSALTRSHVHIWIDLASIDTGDAERDNHLRSSEFFDLEQFPRATFASTDVTLPAGSPSLVRGRLNLHGVWDDIELQITEQNRWTDSTGVERIGHVAKVRLDRRRYGLRWNQDLDVGGIVVGDQIEITARVEATRARP